MSLGESLKGILAIGAGVGTFFITGGNIWSAATATLATWSITHPKGGDIGAGVVSRNGSVQVNTLGSESFIPVVYGRARIGISITDMQQDTGDTNSLALVGALCLAGDDGGGVEEIEKVWFDGDLAIDGATFEGEPRSTNLQAPWTGTGTTYGTDRWVQYGAHSGADTQAVDAELSSVLSYLSTDIGLGVCYIAIWIYFNETIWTGGVPQVTALVKGTKVFDTRDSSTVWSDNSALCIYDFLRSARFGMDIAAANINSTSIDDAANFCDATVSIPGPATQARFTCNGVLDPAGSPLDNLAQLLTSCRGELVRIGSEYHLQIRQVTTAESYELNETNIVGGWEIWKGGTRDVPNLLTAVFIDDNLTYQPNTVMWPEPGAANAFLTADNNYLNARHLELPFTSDFYRAEQIVQTTIKEMRADIGCALTADRSSLVLAQGDVVKLTHPTPSWTDEEFWIVAMGIMPDGNVRMLLRQYDATAYTLGSLATKDVAPGTNIPGVSVDAPRGDEDETVTGDWSYDSSLTLKDDAPLQWGTGFDYWAIYNSAGTAFEFWSTNVDGGGADGIIWKVEDGTDVVDFTDGITLVTALASDYGGTGLKNAGLATGDILHSTDGASWAALNVGTAGQVLTVNAGGTDVEWGGGSLPADPGGDRFLMWDDSDTGNEVKWGTASTGLTFTGTAILIDTSVVPRKAEAETISGVWTHTDELIAQNFLRMQGTVPSLVFEDTDAIGNNKVLQIIGNTESMFFRLVNDAEDTFATWLQMDRTAQNADLVAFTTDAVTMSGTLAVTGAFGCNAAAAQTAFASGGALAGYVTGAFGLDSDANMSALHALVVANRAALVANGIMS